MKKAIACLLLVVCSYQTISAQIAVSVAIPENKSFSAERLQRIDKLIQQYIDSGWIAGAVALVTHNGHTIYYKALGYDDKEQHKKLEKDAIFRIASQTKAITSVAIMQLYEEGRLLLDDPISKYIPGFKNPVVLNQFNKADSSYTTVPAKREVTIRDLLTHTSGISYAQIGTPVANAIYAKAGVVGGIGLLNGTSAENIERLAHLPLMHQPGEHFTYGLNTDVLGYLVEVLSGQSLAEYFRERIFEPLGMKDSYFYLPKEKYNRLAMLHSEDKSKHVVNMEPKIGINGEFYRDYPLDPDGKFYSGGGGLVSTAYDYTLFMESLMNGGVLNGKRILSAHSIRLMTQNQIGDLYVNGSRLTKFGLGFEIVTDAASGRSTSPPGTFSWGGMFSSTYWIDPQEKITAQFVLQQFPNSHGDIGEKFKVLVYQALQ